MKQAENNRNITPLLDFELNNSRLKHQFWGPPWRGRFVVQKVFMVQQPSEKNPLEDHKGKKRTRKVGLRESTSEYAREKVS